MLLSIKYVSKRANSVSYKRGARPLVGYVRLRKKGEKHTLCSILDGKYQTEQKICI